MTQIKDALCSFWKRKENQQTDLKGQHVLFMFCGGPCHLSRSKLCSDLYSVIELFFSEFLLLPHLNS